MNTTIKTDVWFAVENYRLGFISPQQCYWVLRVQRTLASQENKWGVYFLATKEEFETLSSDRLSRLWAIIKEQMDKADARFSGGCTR